MANSSSEITLDEEVDRLVFLCTRIGEMAENIRSIHLSNIAYSPTNIQSCCQSLLSMAENIEGSVILLESLFASQQRNEIKKLKRIYYSREKLLQLRNNVTGKLSYDIGIFLQEVVERECKDSVGNDRKSWRDIRTILM
jgi:hypothetical protein